MQAARERTDPTSKRQVAGAAVGCIELMHIYILFSVLDQEFNFRSELSSSN